MSKALELPYYTIGANDFAAWLDRTPQTWWTVDGDYLLTSRVDFPCPGEELSREIRAIDRSLQIFDPRSVTQEKGSSIEIDEIDKLADTKNNSRAKTFLMSWEGDDTQWLLSEDTEASEALSE